MFLREPQTDSNRLFFTVTPQHQPLQLGLSLGDSVAFAENTIVVPGSSVHITSMQRHAVRLATCRQIGSRSCTAGTAASTQAIVGVRCQPLCVP